MLIYNFTPKQNKFKIMSVIRFEEAYEK